MFSNLFRQGAAATARRNDDTAYNKAMTARTDRVHAYMHCEEDTEYGHALSQEAIAADATTNVFAAPTMDVV